MAKATTTIRQILNYDHAHGEWLHANQALFNRVASFYFEVIQAHIKALDLSNKEALTALEKLTYATKINPNPVMPLTSIGEDIPAMSRRAALNAALGSARSFSSNRARWRKGKEKAEAKGKKFTERPPVPPRTWNKSATLYAGMWKERVGSFIRIKVWTGTCWSWFRVCVTGREIPEGFELCSPQLVHRGGRWYLHTPIEWHRPEQSLKDGRACSRYHQPTTFPIGPELRSNCSGKRRRWGVRSRRIFIRAECHNL